MSPNGLAKHYPTLTPEERFRLIVAAHGRGDTAEADRLSAAAKRITFSNWDYSPYAHAFIELAIVTLLELLDDVARHDEARQRWTDDAMRDFFVGKRRRGTRRKDSTTLSDGPRDLYLAVGFILRTKAAGWRLFCERMGIAPFALWKYLPGFERLQKALTLLEGTSERSGPAFGSADMVNWLNRVRPAGAPEATETGILTPAKIADETEEAFRERARWWGDEG
jgi:hypothetical protein